MEARGVRARRTARRAPRPVGGRRPDLRQPSELFLPGERTGTFRLGGDDLPAGADGTSSISAEGYAVALLNEIETPRHRRQRFTVGC
ncbi:hypothetical protein V7793_28005 [Streptomyces sp. KLMMK]|uniref:hypothetical protein n=1 Tax=Streptomyces sp. KLMMK TaxID=3109353 RepID=UPI00300B4E6B